MAAERRNPDCHEREEREIGQDIVKFVSVGNVEYAKVRMASRHSPQMAPNAPFNSFAR